MMVCRVLLISILGISPAFAQAAAGWRTDGAGKYPSATPVTEWSPTKNVVWKTKMPSWSNASPVLAGGRIFVCSEPFTLLCIDAKDGEILWQKTNSYLDALAPEAAAKERGRVEKRRKIAVKAKAIQKEQRATNEERERVTRELKRIAGAATLTLSTRPVSPKHYPFRRVSARRGACDTGRSVCGPQSPQFRLPGMRYRPCQMGRPL